MVLRMNRREGNYFWGCRRYPACRGTRDIGSDSGESQVEDTSESPTQVRVLWNDATLDRNGWQCRYTAARPFLQVSRRLRKDNVQGYEHEKARSAGLRGNA